MDSARTRGLLAVAVLVAVKLVALTGNASAHDQFLLPTDQVNERGHTIVQFRVGHAGEFNPWPHGLKQVAALRDFAPDGVHNLLQFVEEATAAVPANQTGTHIIALESYRSTSTLPAERFNAYVEKEGLSAIADDRAANGQTEQPGREHYSRRAKTLIQTGNTLTEHVTLPVGLMLEITPLTHPMAIEKGDVLTLLVEYRGQPLANAKVGMELLTLEVLPKQTAKTDARGQVSFAVPTTGTWKFTTVWGVPKEHDDVEFETIFSSLTFTLPPN
ncbi:MAG: DUF4198 domain-containing protein [Pseudomonadota bacterium]